jgi:hypothetical protein
LDLGIDVFGGPYLAKRHADTRLNDKEVRRSRDRRGRAKAVRRNQGGAVGGSHFLQELGRHQTGPENLACVLASRGFQVEREEGMEEVVGQKGQQQETFDGIGVMAKDVIGMPSLDELLESVVLDILALVAENHGAAEPAFLPNCFCAAAICSGRLKRKHDTLLPLLEHAIAYLNEFRVRFDVGVQFL